MISAKSQAERILLAKLQSIPHEITEHEPVFTCEQACRVRGNKPCEGSKNLLLRSAEGEFILAVLPGDMAIDFRRLEKFIGTKKLRFAIDEEIISEVGCEKGCVPPFGHAKPHRTFVDPRLFESEHIYFNPGNHSKTVKIRAGDFRRLLERATEAEFGRLPEK